MGGAWLPLCFWIKLVNGYQQKQFECTDQRDAAGRIPREPNQKAVIGWALIHQPVYVIVFMLIRI